MEVIKKISTGANFVRENKYLMIGFAITIVIILFSILGRLFVNPDAIRMGANPLNQPPSSQYPLGTDTMGKDILTLMVMGTPRTLEIGLLAGGIGTLIGVLLGFVAGYYRGFVDNIIRSAADVMLTIPLLVMLIIIATFVRVMSIEMIGFIIAIFSWPWPTRTMRSQVLSLRERKFIHLAKLSGLGGFEIIFKELLPNLLPYIAAGFVGSTSAGILAAIGLEMLGLGPQHIPTLGMTLYWALFHTAVMRGLWWWWMPPMVILIITFVGLFLISMGLDEFANPRLRRRPM